MICPRCNNEMSIDNTHGVEIDYCPNCKGVWLDGGKLERIIEQSDSLDSSAKEVHGHHDNQDKHQDDHAGHQQGHYGHRGNHSGHHGHGH